MTEEIQESQYNEEDDPKKIFTNADTPPLTDVALIKDLDNLNTPEQIKYFAKDLIKSRLLPDYLDKPEKVLLVIQYGRELGLGAVTALSNFYMINGRIGMQVHLIGGLLQKAGWVYTLERDYEPGTKEGNYITEIKFSQYKHGRWFDQLFKFSKAEAVLAGWADNPKKPVWDQMPKIMLRNRALAIGARFVAPGAMLGILTIDEIADIEDVPYTVDGDNRVHILK